MRNFIYSIYDKKTSRSIAGFKVTASVYELKDNMPIHLGFVDWSTASFKGEKSAVMNFLQENSILVDEATYYHERGDFRIFPV